MCLGKNVALLEMKKLVPALVLNFEVSSLSALKYRTYMSYYGL